MQDLGTLGGTYSYANGINASGQVVGQASTADFSYHAFLKNPGEPMQDLGTLGGTYSYAYGINASGQVVGQATSTVGSSGHAFFKARGQPMQDLGTLGGNQSCAYNINASGQVVGNSYIGPMTAILWTQSEGMKDLNTLVIDKPIDVILSDANATNEVGQVVGNTLLWSHPFLLTPIP